MSHTKEAVRQKRRTKALPVLGAAGLSLSLASGASAAIGGMNPDTATSPPVAQQVMDEEENSDVSLATFHVFRRESAGTQQPRTRPIMVSQGACGIGFYYPQNPPTLGGPVYRVPPPPRSRPIRPAHKYKRL
jgi:hypothetical protein